MGKLTLIGTFYVLIGAAIAMPLEQSDQATQVTTDNAILMQRKGAAEGQSNKDVTDGKILNLKQLVNETIDEQLGILNRAARYRTLFLARHHKARVDKLIAENMGLKPEDIKPETPIYDGGLPSLDFVELWMAVEEEFDTEIPDDEAFKLKTVQDIYDYVASAQ